MVNVIQFYYLSAYKQQRWSMNRLGEREKGSKVYKPNAQSICMNNDSFHQKITDQKVEETKNVQERKQIDKILQGVIKERMFGFLLADEGKLSNEGVTQLDKINKHSVNNRVSHLSIARRNHMNKTIDMKIDSNTYYQYATIQTDRKTARRGEFEPKSAELNFQRTNQGYFTGRTVPIKKYETLDLTSNKKAPEALLPSGKGKLQSKASINSSTKQLPTKLPRILSPSKSKEQPYQPKKLFIDQKTFSELFRKFANNTSVMIYDVKINRESIYSKCKAFVEFKLIERFFQFFGFPLTIGYRQYCNLMQNAVNCPISFTYFFVFSLIDESGNGFVTVSDMFRFMQKFHDNSYIEPQIYLIAREIERVSKALRGEEREIEPTVEEMLVLNKNIRMEELKDLLKQSKKERLAVNCVKSTCYHQTVLSLDHDPLERLKQDQIENTELESRKLNSISRDEKKNKMMQDGIRLRDFPSIFEGKRPKIFCLFTQLLVGERASDFE